jgi:hypothetical protein
MKVTEPQFTVGKSKQPAGYVRSEPPNLQAVGQGLDALGGGITQQANALFRLEAEEKQKADQMARFKATASLVDYNTQVELEQNEFRQTLSPDDPAAAKKAIDLYVGREAEFIKTLPPDLQEEFTMRVADTRSRVTTSAYDFQDKQLSTYYKSEIEKRAQTASGKLAEDPELLDAWRADIHGMIETSDLSETEKFYLTQKMDEFIETGAYRSKVRQNRLSDAQYADDLVTASRQASEELGIDVLDLLTVISFETGGTFSTGIRGGAGNRHIGLIQFGENEQKQFGAVQGQPVGEQMAAVVRYLKARGFKPGMGLLDLYSTINAGSPGRYNASDANNGGTPGTVADKVRTQMAEHRAKAAQLLGGKYIIPDDIDTDPRFSNVPYEARMAARSDTNTEINQIMTQMREERKIQQNEYMNTVQNAALEGKFTRLDYDREVAEGRLTEYKDRAAVLKIIEKREKDAAEGNVFSQRLATGMTLDPTDTDNKKGMNGLFGETGVQALNNRDEAYVNNNLVPTFVKHGMIAPDAIGVFGALARSNDSRQMLFALQSLKQLEIQNPNAYRAQVKDDGLRHLADRWDVLKNVYVGEEGEKKLIEMLQGPRSPEQRRERQALREDGAKAFDTGKITVETLEEAFDAELPLGWKGDAMEREFRQLFIENYAETGGIDPTVAKELAVKHLKDIWGVSSVGGRETIMRHPPEKFYPTIGGTHEWMQRQLRGETGIGEDEEPIIFPDLQTENEISAGQVPTYPVMVLKEGVLRELIVDGRPYRQRFEVTEEDRKADLLSAQIEKKRHDLYEYEVLLETGETWKTIRGSNPPEEVVPPDIKETVDRLRMELQELEGVGQQQSTAAETQYETPSQQRIKQLQLEFDPINEELMNWVEPAEDFPQIERWEALHDEIEKLKIEAAKELKARREKIGDR